jgi:L-glyceraldehyde 3-phosphate reductase
MPREEIIIATKSGFPMWPGPYGEGASRKALVTSLEQSLKRLEMDYVDIFYSHRPDPNTPLEETLRALDYLVRQGKALYVGLSNYPAGLVAQAQQIVREQNLAPIIVNQVGYSMLRRDVEREVLPTARENGVGVVAFSALAQGLLSEKYLAGVPESSRATRRWTPAEREAITPALVDKLRKLNEIAKARGQSLPQMAIAWTLRAPEVASALIGASDIDQIEENVQALEKLTFGEDELRQIDAILAS